MAYMKDSNGRRLDSIAVPSTTEVALTDSIPKTAKAAGDTASGLIDWLNDSAVGYLFHLRMGANSAAGTATIGIGMDAGAGDGLTISAKGGATGRGINATAHPGTGLLALFNNYNKLQPATLTQVYRGAGEARIVAQAAEGFADGQSVNGSTTFTSLTAAFTAADIGRGLRSTVAGIPTNTTIVSITNATTVVLSQAATLSSGAMTFAIVGRIPDTTQKLLSVRDYDGTTALCEVSRAGTVLAGTVTVGGVGVVATAGAVRVNGPAASSRDIQFQTAGNARWIVRIDGTAESGSDVGSDFTLLSRTDGGASKATVLFVKRSTGQVQATAYPVKGYSSNTAGRPTASAAGMGSSMFDTTLNKPIWSNGTNWVDATGATV